MITKTFTSADQLSPEGQVIDKIFTIKEVETKETEKKLSGSEIALKIELLEDEIKPLQDELNFLKTLK
jgi:hypothetical protein